MNELFGLAREFGMQAVITIAVLFGGWKLMCRILNILEKSNARWQDVVDNLQKTLEQHRMNVNEAHQYQRGEHIEFSKQQIQFNDQQKETTDALHEINLSLGRINGYKHD